MPILIMAMMTAQALDDRSIDLRPGIKVCVGILLGLAAISLLPKKEDDKVIWFKFANYPAYFYLTAAICITGLIILWYIDARENRL